MDLLIRIEEVEDIGALLIVPFKKFNKPNKIIENLNLL